MKCFYHNADFDGVCSAAIIKYRNPDMVASDFIGINYGDEFPSNVIQKGEVVYMVDFSLKIDEMIKLNNMYNLIWIDHHKTAIDDAEEVDFSPLGIRNINKAACELTWEYFSNKEDMPYAVELLGRYDIWDHKDSNTLPFQFGLRSFKEALDPLNKIWCDLFFKFNLFRSVIEKGKTIIKYKKAQNKKYCEAYAFETKIDGCVAIALNIGMANSQVFDSVWDENKHEVMITFVKNSKHDIWTVSLYTSKESLIDVGSIAKLYGGGGHRKAAGFQCVTLPFII